MLKKRWWTVLADRLYLCLRVSDELWYNTTEQGKSYHLFHVGWITYNGIDNKVFYFNILCLSLHFSWLSSRFDVSEVG